MNSELTHKLEVGTASKKSRVAISNFVIRKDSVQELSSIAFDTSNKLHVMAFWCLELVCEKKLKLFTPYIDLFCETLRKLTNDSSIRPATKICYFLTKSNHRKNGISLTQEQEHQIIEALIDRLIQEEKVAAKVYAMKALYVLGKKYDWINDELKLILAQDYPNHSIAYQSCSKKILKKLSQ